ncbi:hypothetical protein C3486_01365 [Streptomyces sp. Ru73]|uniref:DUF6190 family protein n=1 Tax=Streptomyces sp. Ru73 TaxID=2080748 RepID=UPI000CDE1897|nr:DUF6190 family protein [Streptomyces sp. Ru73]POX43228.1 hypothetical protein C3486_01365 [Streptomyces sp. Ru73]
MARDLYVDAALFMGMHSTDTAVRDACAAFFAAHLERPLVMTYEEVGRCDDVVWGYPRAAQDAYYPFMDLLHSVMPVRRRAYTADDWLAFDRLPAPATALSPRERMLLAAVSAGGGELVTVNPRLLALTTPGLPVRGPEPAAGPVRFPDGTGTLDKLYDVSLELVVDHAAV